MMGRKQSNKKKRKETIAWTGRTKQINILKTVAGRT
jgi:hypothetical protein